MTIVIDDISHVEENTIKETANEKPIKVEGQKPIVHKTSGGKNRYIH